MTYTVIIAVVGVALVNLYQASHERLDQALLSGAHFVSTDVPWPVEWTSYVVEIPDGTPSRCNPRSAPVECSSEAIESPNFVH